MEFALEVKPNFWEPVFSVSELCALLDIPPSTLRYWIQRGWLKYFDCTHRTGYLITWSQLKEFVEQHRDKLRKLRFERIEDVIPKEQHPEEVTARILYQRIKKKVLKDYEEWLEKVCMKMDEQGRLAEEILQIGDKELAEQFNLPLPENYEVIREAEPDALKRVKLEQAQTFTRLMQRALLIEKRRRERW